MNDEDATFAPISTVTMVDADEPAHIVSRVNGKAFCGTTHALLFVTSKKYWANTAEWQPVCEACALMALTYKARRAK